MPLTFEEIKNEIAAGLSLQEIADKYSGDRRTNSDVDQRDFVDYLRDERIFYESVINRQWAGSVRARVPAEVLERMIGHLENARFNTAGTHGAEIIGEIIDNLNGPSKSDFISFIESKGSGYRFAGTDLESVTAIFDQGLAAEAEQARRESIEVLLRGEIDNTWLNPMAADGVSTAADVRAAIKAGL